MGSATRRTGALAAASSRVTFRAAEEFGASAGEDDLAGGAGE